MIVTERYTDMAGKYRVTVTTDDNTRAFSLKFQDEVADETSIAEAQRIIDTEKGQKAEQDYLQSLLDEEKKLMEELGYGSD